MGDDRNITMEKLQAAADAAGISVKEAADNIAKSASENR